MWVYLKVIISYQFSGASQKQNFCSEALGNQSFLAGIADPAHHHQCFSVDHIWSDPSGITQQGGGHIHQRILQLVQKQDEDKTTERGEDSSLGTCIVLKTAT